MDKTSKEIGELLFTVIDNIKSTEKKKKKIQKDNDTHYLERLLREIPEGTKSFWKLKARIKSHPEVNYRASELAINTELDTIFNFTRKMEEIRKLDPENAGQEIINNLIIQISPYIVIFQLKDFLPNRKGFSFGNAAFGIYQEILESYNVPEYKPPRPEKQHFNAKKSIFNILSYKEKEYMDIVCVGTEVFACDKIAAFYLAKKEINSILNFIRLLLPLNYSLLKRPQIGVNEALEISKAFIISITDGERLFPVSDSHFGRLGIFTLSKSQFKTSKSIENADEIFKKAVNERSNLEKRILSALDWIGEGVNSFEKDIKIVKCVVGLEVLFRLPVEEKQRRFIKYVTKLFEHFKENDDYIEKKAKNIYGLRSSIVHRGKRDITDEEAELAERLASGCMLRVFEKMDDFSSEEDIDNWLNSDD